MAWLHATPEGSKKARRTSFLEVDEHSSFLKLPDISEGAEYMVSLLSEAGFALSSGFGATPITWTELDSWLSCTKHELSVWEITTLKEMSEVYCSELHKSSAKDAAPPYVPTAEVEDEELAEQRKSVASKIRNVFASFKRNSGNEPNPQN